MLVKTYFNLFVLTFLCCCVIRWEDGNVQSAKNDDFFAGFARAVRKKDGFSRIKARP